MQKWANNIKNIQEDRRIKLVIIAANNHYARFAPGTVNIFRSMLGLPKAKWQDSLFNKSKARTLDSFVSQTDEDIRVDIYKTLDFLAENLKTEERVKWSQQCRDKFAQTVMNAK